MTEYTAAPMVSFELEEGDAGLFDCKIGGAYYVPEGEHRLENSRTGGDADIDQQRRYVWMQF